MKTINACLGTVVIYKTTILFTRIISVNVPLDCQQMVQTSISIFTLHMLQKQNALKLGFESHFAHLVDC